MGDIDFEEQLRLEALERQKKAREADQTSYKDADGTVYEWDEEKRAWFPKVDADFMAQYQLNYGEQSESSAATTDTTAATPQSANSNEWPDPNSPGYAEWYYAHFGHLHNADGSYKADAIAQSVHPTAASSSGANQGMSNAGSTDEAQSSSSSSQSQDTLKRPAESSEDKQTAEEDTNEESGKKKKKRPVPKPPAWFETDEEHNTNVYVSGLPTDITEKEFEEFMGKCGLIVMDPRLLKLKLKLYKDDDGNLKGDGRCCYIKKESVELALQILDGSVIRGHTVSVQKAQFQMKGEFDAKKAQRKLTNKQKKKRKEQQQRLLDWRLNEKTRDEEVVGNEAPPLLFL